MGKPTGFLEIARVKQPSRRVAERIGDWREVPLPYPAGALEGQAARCTRSFQSGIRLPSGQPW